MPKGQALWALQPRIMQLSEVLVRWACGHAIDSAIFSDWSPQDWRLARAIAWSQGILGLLHLRGECQPVGPEAWREYLSRQYASNGARIARMLELQAAIVREMNARGVTPMLLKGGDLVTRAYDDPALRPIGDIDMLVRPDDMARAGEAVTAAGFASEGGIKRHDVFVLPPNTVAEFLSEHPDNPIKVELHPSISGHISRLPYDLTDTLWRDSTEARWRGHTIRRASLPALALHLLVHATSDMHPRTLRSVRLLDSHLVFARMAGADWERFMADLRRLDGIWWAYPPAALTERYYPGTLPAEVLKQLGKGTHLSLRWMLSRASATGLSACNVRRTRATEFAAWARTPWQAFNHAATIVMPTRDDRETWTLKTAAPGTSRGWGNHVRRLKRAFNPAAVRAQSEMLFSLID